MREYYFPKREEWREILRPAADRFDKEKITEVWRMLEELRKGGDVALASYAKAFDGFEADDFRVPASDIERAGCEPALARAIDTAIANIESYHTRQARSEFECEPFAGVRLRRRVTPIRRVGFYVPGGSAPLFSSLLMMAVPARIAGCREQAVFTPPARDGTVNAAILYCAGRLGIREVYRLGGVQAIAAMAFGSGTIPAVDKIFGPGNSWVTVAKQLMSLYGVATDLPAGPSEIAVVAGPDADPEFIAADLLSQAEHGPDSGLFLLTTDRQTLERVAAALEKQAALLPRAAQVRPSLEKAVALVLGTLEECLDAANLIAPEHLVLACEDACARLDLVECAGSVFLGRLTPETLGDYASGANHVLPTGGQATARSGLCLEDFQKSTTVQSITAKGLAAIGPTLETLASAESLVAHGAAVSLRLARIAAEAGREAGRNG